MKISKHKYPKKQCQSLKEGPSQTRVDPPNGGCVLGFYSFFFLSFLPFFHLLQINRVALIQCVSCRLPRRLFDPVFHSLPLGQTCFSSVCCTPALEAAAAAAAALRQTIGCCLLQPPHLHHHLFPTPLPVALTFCCFSPLYRSLPFSFSYHPFHLALLPFGHATVQPPPPPLSQGILDAQRKGRGQGSGQNHPPRRNLRKRGMSSISPPPLPPKLLTLSLSSPEESAATRLHPPHHFIYLGYLLNCFHLKLCFP